MLIVKSPNCQTSHQYADILRDERTVYIDEDRSMPLFTIGRFAAAALPPR